MAVVRFRNREDAGRQMAKALAEYGGKDTVVLGLPRGGIVPAAEISERLKSPLDVALVRKISHPLSPEYAVGAVALEGKPILNDDEAPDKTAPWLIKSIETARELNKKRFNDYYSDQVKPISLEGKQAILVDDGIATGFTMEAAIEYVKKKGAKKIVVATAVAPLDSAFALRKKVDEFLVVNDTENFLGAVGAHYNEFEQVSDQQVIRLLREGRKKDI